MGQITALLNQLGINDSFYVMLAIFVVTFFVCSLIALKPLNNILVERDKRMAGRELEIEKLTAELNTVKAELESQRLEAQKVASKKFTELKAKAQDEHKQILAEARAKSAAELKAIKDKLEQNYSSEKTKLESEISSIEEHLVQGLVGKGA